jgi:hypothetical protein
VPGFLLDPRPPTTASLRFQKRTGRGRYGLAIITSVALTTAVTESPILSAISSALRLVMTDSITPPATVLFGLVSVTVALAGRTAQAGDKVY